MTELEYKQLQRRFIKKIIRNPNNKQDAYNKGILACKSILKEVYEEQKNKDFANLNKEESDE